MRKRNDMWRERKGAGKRGGPGRKMYVDAPNVSLWHYNNSSSEELVAYFHPGRLLSWSVGKMFLIFGLNRLTDKKMFLANSGNETQKYLLDVVCALCCAVCWENDWEGGPIMRLLWQFTLMVYSLTWPSYFSITVGDVRESLHPLMIIFAIISYCFFVPIYSSNNTEQPEQVEVIWSQRVNKSQTQSSLWMDSFTCVWDQSAFGAPAASNALCWNRRLIKYFPDRSVRCTRVWVSIFKL